MVDLGKVIKAFEWCTATMKDNDPCPTKCPYYGKCMGGDNGVFFDVMKDAISLLKAQEPGWISVKARLPEDDRTVLAVKRLKDGRRDMCLARCIPDYECYDVETCSRIKRPYWVCGGNNNIIYWMPLPGMPKEET